MSRHEKNIFVLTFLVKLQMSVGNNVIVTSFYQQMHK